MTKHITQNKMSVEADEEMRFSYAPSVQLTLTPILSPPRFQLSTCFLQRRRPVETNKMVWKTLRKCTSSRHEAVVLPLKPFERVLIVALVGSAVAEINHDIQINHLQKSIEFRDELLSSMQQKLDSLCEQMNVMNQPETMARSVLAKNFDSDGFGADEFKFVDCGSWLCEHHTGVPTSMLDGNTVRLSSGDEVTQSMMPTSCEVEPEERRMSDLSDWSSSVTSCADVQVSSFLAEEDSCNLKSECEEKDLIIKELRILLHSSDATTKKRIAELEDLIQRKTTIITKLRKDMLVLEQKAVQLTRVSGPSSSAYSPSSVQRPVLKDNLVYNMADSTTSPSSSDSDSSPAYRSRAIVGTSEENSAKSSGTSFKNQKNVASSSSSSTKANEHKRSTRLSSQLKERSSNQKSELVSSRRKTQLGWGKF